MEVPNVNVCVQDRKVHEGPDGMQEWLMVNRAPVQKEKSRYEQVQKENLGGLGYVSFL